MISNREAFDDYLFQALSAGVKRDMCFPYTVREIDADGEATFTATTDDDGEVVALDVHEPTGRAMFLDITDRNGVTVRLNVRHEQDWRS